MHSCNSLWVETLTHHFKKPSWHEPSGCAEGFRFMGSGSLDSAPDSSQCVIAQWESDHTDRGWTRTFQGPIQWRNKLFGTPEINLVPSFSFFAVGCKHSANLAIFQNNWHNYLRWAVHLKSIMRAVRSLPLGAANPPNGPCDRCLVIIYVPEAS